MKWKAHFEGHGVRTDCFYNPEGYADPTAGSAINGNCEIYAAPLVWKPGEKEKVMNVELRPVSELVAFITALGYSIREEEGVICAGKRWKGEKQIENRTKAGDDTDHVEDEAWG